MRQAWVISGWGVLDPLLRYNLAKQAGKQDLVHHHNTFWLTEGACRAAPPTMLKRGNARAAGAHGGDREVGPVELMRSFVADYNKAGGHANCSSTRAPTTAS
jgi:hypothetical protein